MFKLTDTSTMPYGKYQGRHMQDVPADYLLWLHENGKCSDRVAMYVQNNMQTLERRRTEEKDARKQRAAVIMPFGSYKGYALCDVPAEYMMAMYENGKCPKNILAYIEQNMAAIQAQAEKDRNNRAALRTMY